MSRVTRFSVILVILQAVASPCSAAIDPCDPNATVETAALLRNLDTSRHQRLIFGAHETTRFMVTSPPPGETVWSDVRNATGQWPGLFSTQMNFAVKWNDAPGEREQIRFARSLGAPVTMAWHMDNPVTGGGSGDLNIDIASILPGGANHQLLVAKLSEGADFLETLTDDQGRPIPIIYRPYHEHNLLQAYWWNTATPEQFKELWQFTVDYFRETRGLHNLLHAYCPNFRYAMAQGDITANYLEYYPGDDYVDVFGLDYYGDLQATGRLDVLRTVVLEAEARGKLPAFAETGVKIGAGYADPTVDPLWFARDLLDVLKSDPATQRLAYTMTWYNKPGQYWVPYAPGVRGYDAFMEFINDPWTALADQLPSLYETAPAGDFDLDGDVDAMDVDLLRGQIASGLNAAAYDLTGDGLVDQADADAMIHDVLGTEYGDATLDGKVDAGDLSLLAAYWQHCPNTWAKADFTGNGCVAADDLSLLAGNWQWQRPAGASVPEPATLLLAMGGLAVLGRRSR